jgi:hypothetical protein
MASATDPRREVGARVQTKPHFLTSEAQAHRYFGTAAKTTLVPGTVLAVETDSSGARAHTSVDVRWELPGRYLTKSVPIRSVTFLGSNTTPIAGATVTPAPAVAGMADEDAARRHEENKAYSRHESRPTLPQSPPDVPIVVHGIE